jgi:hypothetical protein
MEQAGRAGDMLTEELDAIETRIAEVDADSEWASLSPALVKSLYPPVTPK